MTNHRRLFACCALLGLTAALSAQDNPNVRKVEDKGVYFTLPKGWQWASDSDVIAIKQVVTIKDVEHEIEAELIYETKKFADDLVKDVQQKVADSQGSMKELKVTKKQKMGTVKGSVAQYVRTKGEGEDARHFNERIFIFKRGDGSFSWIERCPKPASGPAASAFEAARKAFTFKDTAETSIPPLREFKVLKGSSYKLPEDFEWADRAEAKSGEQDANGPVAHVYTEVDVKGAEFRCDFQLYMRAPDEGKKYPDQAGLYADFSKNFDPKKLFNPPLAVTEDLKVEKKGDLAGEKTVFITWKGASDKNAPMKTYSMYVMNKKGILVQWLEITPWTKKPEKEVEAALRTAKSGLNF